MGTREGRAPSRPPRFVIPAGMCAGSLASKSNPMRRKQGMTETREEKLEKLSNRLSFCGTECVYINVWIISSPFFYLGMTLI